jgi:hypothetical protein
MECWGVVERVTVVCALHALIAFEDLLNYLSVPGGGGPLQFKWSKRDHLYSHGHDQKGIPYIYAFIISLLLHKLSFS